MVGNCDRGLSRFFWRRTSRNQKSDLFSFLLGAKRLSPSLPDYDSPELHLLNFRFIRDVAAVYYRTTCMSAFKKRDRHVNSTVYLISVNVLHGGFYT